MTKNNRMTTTMDKIRQHGRNTDGTRTTNRTNQSDRADQDNTLRRRRLLMLNPVMKTCSGTELMKDGFPVVLEKNMH